MLRHGSVQRQSLSRSDQRGDGSQGRQSSSNTFSTECRVAHPRNWPNQDFFHRLERGEDTRWQTRPTSLGFGRGTGRGSLFTATKLSAAPGGADPRSQQQPLEPGREPDTMGQPLRDDSQLELLQAAANISLPSSSSFSPDSSSDPSETEGEGGRRTGRAREEEDIYDSVSMEL